MSVLARALSFLFNSVHIYRITYICVQVYICISTTPKKNFEMTRQDFCALQDKKKKGDLEMCRASVLHARCSMRIFFRKAEEKEQTTVVNHFPEIFREIDFAKFFVKSFSRNFM